MFCFSFKRYNVQVRDGSSITFNRVGNGIDIEILLFTASNRNCDQNPFPTCRIKNFNGTHGPSMDFIEMRIYA